MTIGEAGSGSASGAGAHPDYRPDIDGLRAVAVLAVVGFHAFPLWMPGGLIGVDIFFVISGFLISTIILKGLQQGRFSYIDFYVRRIKRIFPALALMLLACLVFGWFTLYDGEYKALGKHVAGGAGFVANIVLWTESGYFDAQAQLKELLHLWSLGIEEQFYLLWPLLLALLWKKTHTFLPLIVSLLLLSFVLNAALIGSQPIATFYLPDTRFWELMVGAVLAYAVQSKAAWLPTAPNNKSSVMPTGASSTRLVCEASAWLGAALLAAALLVVNDTRLYPGALALLPTFGAFFLIAAGPTTTLNRYLLASRPLVFVGLISYPLYLWHWPLLSFARILGSAPPGRALRAALVLLSFLLAWLSYRFLEKPIRTSRGRVGAVVLLALVAVIGGAGFLVYRDNGLDKRAINAASLDAKDLLAAGQALDENLRTVRYRPGNCADLKLSAVANKFCDSYGAPGGDTIVLWGDSHAWAWAPVFYRIAEERKLRVIRFSIGACPPFIQTRRGGAVGKLTSCYTFGNGENFLDAIKLIKPKQIFMIAYWSLYTSVDSIEAQRVDTGADPPAGSSVFEAQLAKTLQALPKDTAVTIFRTTPLLVNDLERGLLRKVKIEPTAAEHALREADADHAIDEAARTQDNVKVFDPAALMCSQTCKAIFNGTLMYFDSGHISAQGALLYKDVLLSDFFSSQAGHELHVKDDTAQLSRY